MTKRTLILIVSFLLGVNVQLYSKAVPNAKNGILDLSNWDFNEDKSLQLDGEWLFFWKSFRDSSSLPAEAIVTIVPGLWNNLSVTEGESFGYGTYELLVILPRDRPPLAMSLPDQYSAYRFEINGKFFTGDGQIGTGRDNYIPEFNTITRALPAMGDTLYLSLKVANFDHSKGGFARSIRLGTSALFQRRVENFSLDIFLTGSLLMGGLFFLGLYLFGNQSKPILYFSLFCVSWGYRIISSGMHSLHSLIDISWELALRLEYISMFLTAYFFTRYVYFLYKSYFPFLIEKILLTGFSLLTLAALFLPPFWFTQTIVIFFALVVPGLITVLYAMVKSALFKRYFSIYGVISILVIFFVFIYFFLSYFGYFERSVFVSFLGSLVFVFLQSLILSFRYSRELKDAKEAAEQASNAKTEFLSTMSHEIRTPLNAVIGLSNFLIEENPREDQKESLNNLRFSSENLLSLINDILDYNKIDAGKIDFEEKPLNVRRLLDRTIAAYNHIAEEKGIELTYKVDQHVPEYIKGDITRISQILTNLIGNAIKFTKKGYVEVSLDFVARTEDKVALKFMVQDTGVGIPEQKQQLIFESFTQASSATTREFGGSGLGLSITDKLLGLMGSRLYLKSEVGVGSIFYFTQFFEVAERSDEKPVISSNKGGQGLKGSRVLIVEDTTVNILVAEKFLEKWGMIVDSAENGKLAVDKFKEHHYDIILMDLQMPVMDGYEATRLIRQTDPHVPIIALTAAAVTEVIEKIEEVGMNAYVTKPFNPVVLHDKIKECLIAES